MTPYQYAIIDDAESRVVRWFTSYDDPEAISYFIAEGSSPDLHTLYQMREIPIPINANTWRPDAQRTA
jgi:hypothetical protein